jgi:HSP20 family protein
MTLPTRLSRALVDPFDSVSRDLESFARRVFTRDGNAVPATFAVDIYEDNDKLHVKAELPGFTAEQVDVTIDNSVLTITAERAAQTPQQEPTGEYLLRERHFARLQRSFTLPSTVDENSISAKLDAGVLHLSIDKRQEAKPRKIAING